MAYNIRRPGGLRYKNYSVIIEWAVFFMYINDLGMRENHNIGNDAANRSEAVNTRTGKAAAADMTGLSNTAAAGSVRFPTALQQAVESQNVLSSAATAKIEEALDRLKSNPEWEDVGTTLEAMYKNQQTMQMQMNLLSAGYSSGLTGLTMNTLYGSGSSLSGLYSGTTGLLGTSIFGDMLL